MIGMLEGNVIYSDGKVAIINTQLGVGYEINLFHQLKHGERVQFFISHIIKEASQELFGFNTFYDKQIFELLLSVKGVGPKSAYSLVSSLGAEVVTEAILCDNKDLLRKAPGVGGRAAAQIVLDLGGKVHKLKVETVALPKMQKTEQISEVSMFEEVETQRPKGFAMAGILSETLNACSELGFKESDITSLAQDLIKRHSPKRSEDLVRLILREM